MQWDLSKNHIPIPKASPIDQNNMMCFTFRKANESTAFFCEATLSSRKHAETIKFEKFKRTCRVTVTCDGKLKCYFCDYSVSKGSPSRHIISCNQRKVSIGDFHIRHCKSYNCGSMVGKIVSKYGDHNLPNFRGEYDMSSIDASNEESTQTDHGSNVIEELSDAITIPMSSSCTSINKSKEFYSRCTNTCDHMWSVVSKPLSSSALGTIFFENMMKECERKTAEFIEKNHENK